MQKRSFHLDGECLDFIDRASDGRKRPKAEVVRRCIKKGAREGVDSLPPDDAPPVDHDDPDVDEDPPGGGNGGPDRGDGMEGDLPSLDRVGSESDVEDASGDAEQTDDPDQVGSNEGADPGEADPTEDRKGGVISQLGRSAIDALSS